MAWWYTKANEDRPYKNPVVVCTPTLTSLTTSGRKNIQPLVTYLLQPHSTLLIPHNHKAGSTPRLIRKRSPPDLLRTTAPDLPRT